MKLLVNGVMRNVSADQFETFKDQFVELVSLLKQTNQTPKIWMESFFGNDHAIRVVLAQAKLSALATETGIAFLRKKIEELEVSSEIEIAKDDGHCGYCPRSHHNH